MIWAPFTLAAGRAAVACVWACVCFRFRSELAQVTHAITAALDSRPSFLYFILFLATNNNWYWADAEHDFD